MNKTLKRIIFLVLAALTIGAFEFVERKLALFDQWNETYLEFLMGNAIGKFDAPSVTLVRVDESHKELFADNGWPPSQLDWAVILRTLETHDPEAVGIVAPLKFEESDTISQGVLKTQVLKLPRLVMGVALGPQGEGSSPVDPSKFSVMENFEGDLSRLPEAQAVVAATEDEFLVNGKTAFTHIELKEEMTSGPNGIRIPLLARSGDKALASFVLQMLMAKGPFEPQDVKVVLGPTEGTIRLVAARVKQDLKGKVEAAKTRLREAKSAEGSSPEMLAKMEAEVKNLEAKLQRTKDVVIPVDANANLLVYPGSRMRVPSVKAAELVLAASEFGVAEELNKESEKVIEGIDDNMVLIGFDNEDAKQFTLLDGGKISRTELLSMAVATVQGGYYVRYWSPILRYIVLGGLVLIGLYLMGSGSIKGFFSGILVLFLYIMVGGILVFKSSLTWTPPFTAAAICAVIMLVGLIPLANGSVKRKEEKQKEEQASAEAASAKA